MLQVCGQDPRKAVYFFSQISFWGTIKCENKNFNFFSSSWIGAGRVKDWKRCTNNPDLAGLPVEILYKNLGVKDMKLNADYNFQHQGTDNYLSIAIWNAVCQH